MSAVSETSTTCHLILKTRSTDLPLTTLYISAYSLLGSITRHPQCLIAECQQILPVRCCSDSCNHYRNMHRYIQVQQAGKDIFEYFGSLYLCSRGGSDHGLQLELVLVRTLWAQYPHHRQINHDQLVPPSPDWQCGFVTSTNQWSKFLGSAMYWHVLLLPRMPDVYVHFVRQMSSAMIVD